MQEDEFKEQFESTTKPQDVAAAFTHDDNAEDFFTYVQDIDGYQQMNEFRSST